MAGKRLVAFALALAALVAGPRALVADPPASSAPPVPPGEALEMTADTLEVDVEAKTAVLSGNVRLSRGAMAVRCPRLDVRYDDAPQVLWAKASGGVVAEIRGTRAEAPEAELDMSKQILELRGGVRLANRGAWLKAEQATIHTVTGKVTMTDVKGSLPVSGKPVP